MKNPYLPASCVLLALSACNGNQPGASSAPAAPYTVRSAISSAAASQAKTKTKPKAAAPQRSSFSGFPLSFGGTSSLSGTKRYLLTGSGSKLALSNASSTRLGTMTLDGERAVRIKPGRGDSFLVATSGGSILKVRATGGQLRQSAEAAALPDGSTVDFLEGKDGSIHLVSRSNGKVEVNSFRNGAWRPNRAVSSSLSSFQTMKLDPGTGEVVFLGKAPGSNRLAIIRSNSSGSQTDSFLLPETMSLVNDIACVDGELYVASGRGKNATLSVFGADGQLKSTLVTGEISSLDVTYKNGKPVIQAAGANGDALEFDTSKPLDTQSATPVGS